MNLAERMTRSKMVTFREQGKVLKPIYHDSMEELLGITVSEGRNSRFIRTFYTSEVISSITELDDFPLQNGSGIYPFDFIYEEDGRYSASMRKIHISEDLKYPRDYFDKIFRNNGVAFSTKHSRAISDNNKSLITNILSLMRVSRDLPEDAKVDFLNDIEKYVKVLIEKNGLDWNKFTEHTEMFI